MQVRAKYVTEFTIKNGRIRGSRVIGGENASEKQLVAIQYVKPLLTAFVRSRLTGDTQGIINVRVNYVETTHGLEIAFKA